MVLRSTIQRKMSSSDTVLDPPKRASLAQTTRENTIFRRNNLFDRRRGSLDKLKEKRNVHTVFIRNQKPTRRNFVSFCEPRWLFRQLLKAFFLQMSIVLGEQQPLFPTYIFVVRHVACSTWCIQAIFVFFCFSLTGFVYEVGSKTNYILPFFL